MFFNKSHSNFIIASPRSGTTWMSKMLNAHPNIFCVERRLFGDYADLVLDEGANKPRLRVTLINIQIACFSIMVFLIR